MKTMLSTFAEIHGAPAAYAAYPAYAAAAAAPLHPRHSALMSMWMRLGMHMPMPLTSARSNRMRDS